MRLRMIAFVLTVVFFFGPTAWAADYVLIINKANPVSFVSAQDAKNIFLGKKSTWPNGEKIVVFTQTGFPVHSVFVSQVVGKTPQQFSTFWKKALFTGTGIPPRDLQGDKPMMEMVASQPGGIGYVSSASTDNAVKTVEIR